MTQTGDLRISTHEAVLRLHVDLRMTASALCPCRSV